MSNANDRSEPVNTTSIAKWPDIQAPHQGFDAGLVKASRDCSLDSTGSAKVVRFAASGMLKPRVHTTVVGTGDSMNRVHTTVVCTGDSKKHVYIQPLYVRATR